MLGKIAAAMIQDRVGLRIEADVLSLDSLRESISLFVLQSAIRGMGYPVICQERIPQISSLAKANKLSNGRGSGSLRRQDSSYAAHDQNIARKYEIYPW